jgi:phosphopantothenoylcysteine decarboxylase/phosphopantothenate--cysteine ligase
MAESDEIFEACRWLLGRNGTLAGCQVVVTAGGTREPFDPIRFIGNRSSGKMGFALATVARDRGGDVTLIHAPTALSPAYGVQSIPVETALQMHDAVMDKISTTDVLLMAAAVADYRPALLAEQKIKKSEGSRSVELVRNPDILQAVANRREADNRPRLVVGFAAETEDLLENARKKLAGKRLDLMVANDVSATDSGFAVDTNRVTLLNTKGEATPLPLLSKNEVAERIIDVVVTRLRKEGKMGK